MKEPPARLRLAHLPTPLEPAPRLGAALGVSELWVKRDDCTGLALGGSKVRALEYYLHEARAKGAGALLTVGSVYSNHVRLTAAAAARCGLACSVIVTGGEEAGADRLDYVRLLGAEMTFLPAASPWRVASALRESTTRWRQEGVETYTIPMGGAAALGAVGYVESVAELKVQLEAHGLRAPTIVVGVGSGGTLSGLCLGARRHLPGSRIIGVSVGPAAADVRPAVSRIAAATAAMLDHPSSEPVNPEVRDDWVEGGYGAASRRVRDVVTLTARSEGLLVDPVYTGKVVLGIRELRASGVLAPDEPVVFWHSGFSSLAGRDAGPPGD